VNPVTDLETTMRIPFPLGALVIAAWLSLPIAACAQLPFEHYPQHPSFAAAPQQRAALLQGMARGVTFTSSREAYQVLPDARAARLPAGQTLAQRLGELSAAETDLLERKGDMLLYRSRTTGGVGAAVQRHDQTVLFPVVLNTRTQQLGLLPGTIQAKLADPAEAEAVATAHSVSVYKSFPHLGIVFFQVRPGQDVVAAAAAVAGDKRVRSAEPEVVENIRVPR
jgi:hypothetical protein